MLENICRKLIQSGLIGCLRGMISGPLALTKLQLMNKPTMGKKGDMEHLMEKECYHKKIGHDLRNCYMSHYISVV